MIIQEAEDFFTLKNLDTKLKEIKDYVKSCAKESVEAHKVEKEIFTRILKLGYEALGWYLDSQGNGDVGATIEIDEKRLKRSEERHDRVYQTIFGVYKISRYVYAVREKQKTEVMPLDAKLNLPENDYSYVLQDISQMLAVEIPFGQVKKMLDKILSINTSVDTLERINRKMSKSVPDYRENQSAPKKENEGKILVVVRHNRDKARIYDHRSKRGPKPDRKKMATVGTVYSVEPFKRTPVEVADALFCQPSDKHNKRSRPSPLNKRVFPCLTSDYQKENKATDIVFNWMANQVKDRRFGTRKQHILIMDGQPSLWKAGENYLPHSRIEILDLLHVTPKLWEAASIFCPRIQNEKIKFLYHRVLLILQGKVSSVIRGFRRMTSLRNLSSDKQKQVEKICSYLYKNRYRMQYDDYLAKGFPIATGVVEGACLHYIKDRMERTGARWTISGAQAMLEMRATYLNNDWDIFQSYRILKERQKLYPYHDILVDQLVHLIA